MSVAYRQFIKKPIELFTIRVKTDNTGTSGTNQFTFTGAIGNYDVIARNESTNNIQTFSNLSGAATITLADGDGTYELKVRPKGVSNTTRFRQIQFNNGGDRLKLLEIKKWGNVRWTFMSNAFNGCSNLNVTADDVPDLKLVTFLNSMFQGCTSLSGSSANWSWNTSNVTNMSSMFRSATAFNQDLSDWDVSNVTNFGTSLFNSGMFALASAFNNGGVALNWTINNTTSVSMGFMFSQSAFNQDISGWNTSTVTNMPSMFNQSPFNQDIGGWNVGNVVFMPSMFRSTPFNQDIGGWNVGNVVSMREMFFGTTAFNQDISGWDVSKVTSFGSTGFATGMFGSSVFNNGGVALDWTINTSSSVSMAGMFWNNSAFNQDISGWNTSTVTNMEHMFSTSVFNQDIGGWNTSSVTTMNFMFSSNTAFNQNIGGWDTSSVTIMSAMFQTATSFNQDIGDWDISNVTDFNSFMIGKTNLNYSAANLDSIYNKWSLLAVKPNININFGTIKYNSTAQAGKDVLLGAPNNWTITDGGQV